MSILSNVSSLWLGLFLTSLYHYPETLTFNQGIVVSVLVMAWVIIMGFTISKDKSLMVD